MIFKCKPNQSISMDGLNLGTADDKGFLEFDEKKYVDRVVKRMAHAGYEVVQTCVCSQCGETFDNKGLMMTHIKKEHPKK